MEQAKPMARRKHDAQLKELVVAACAVPGASVARIALEHGLNANLTLPRFHVHQIVGNFLMNGERYGQEGAGPEPAVHG